MYLSRGLGFFQLGQRGRKLGYVVTNNHLVCDERDGDCAVSGQLDYVVDPALVGRCIALFKLHVVLLEPGFGTGAEGAAGNGVDSDCCHVRARYQTNPAAPTAATTPTT